MRYYISGLHFWHRSLISKMDHRPFESIEEMNEYMIAQWNSKVRNNDETVIIGDFGFMNGKTANEILDRLNGKKYLIIGNHDKYFLDDKEFDRTKFEWIKDYAELRDNKRTVVLSHYPLMCYNGQYRLDEAGNAKRYMLYGHVHDTQDEDLIDQFIKITRTSRIRNREGNPVGIPCNMINCFCMFSDYIPLSLDEWIAVDEKRRNNRAAKLLLNEE